MDTAVETEAFGDGQVTEISLSAISPNPHQPRKSFDPAAISDLALSIETDALIYPTPQIPCGKAPQK